MNESQNIGLRISELVNHFANGINTKFAELVGTSEANIRNYRNGKMPKYDFIYNVCSVLEINYEWLITGKGQMLKEQNEPMKSIIKEKEQEETRPRIPMDAAAGSLTVAADGITIDNCEQLPVIKAFARYDFTIFARGDSMSPEYHSGDELACIYIRNTSFIQWGRIHVIDTAQGILVKRIFDGGDSIICKSDNSDYPDFRIDKSEFYNIALVIGMIRRY